MLGPNAAGPTTLPVMPGVVDGAPGRAADEMPLPAPRKLNDQIPPPGY
jgi:hypothetical protein